MIDLDKIKEEAEKYAEQRSGKKAKDFVSFCLHCDHVYNYRIEGLCECGGDIANYSDDGVMSEFEFFVSQYLKNTVNRLHEHIEQLEQSIINLTGG